MKKYSFAQKKRVNALFIERSTPFARDVIRLAAGLQEPALDIAHVLSVDEAIRRLASEEFDLILVGFPCKASPESISHLITHIADAPILGFDRKESTDESPGNPLENRIRTSLPKSKVDSFTLGLSIPHVMERHELRNSIGKYVKKLLACEDRYRNIITKNADAILVVDTRGFILYANEAASVLLGRPPEALIGSEFGVPVIVDDSVEIQIMVPGSTDVKSVAMRVGKSEWESQEVSLVSLQDITDRKVMESELTKSQEKARSADEAKNSFLTNISHEIRTPMNGILGMTELLLSTTLTKKQKEYLEMVRLSASSLLEIFNDIIDYSNIEAGRLQLSSTSFNLHALLRSSISIFATLARKKGIATEYIISPDVPVYVTGDPGRLRQVIVNLIGNAIKFTDEGFVRLTAAVSLPTQGQQSSPVKIVFSVEDTGIGISKDNAKIIFDSFTQADGSFTRKFHGTGLGLSICKYLVGMMDGTITVDSEEGHGSTFSFSVMLKPAQGVSMDFVGDLHGDNLPNLPPLNILLAEDNKVNQIFASELLTSKGHAVLAVPNGAEALNALEEHTIDLVLMDVQMPEMDGLEATRRIRSSTSQAFNPKIPIIAMTAHALKGDRETFLSVGMNEYMSKPISWEKLHRTMCAVLSSDAQSNMSNKRETSQHVQESEASYGATSEEHVSLETDILDLDIEGLVHKARGNMDFLKKMFHVFVSDQPNKFQEMREAFDEGDMKHVSFLAHALKGAAATMGAPRLRDAAYWLEVSAKAGKKDESAENLDHIEHRLEQVIHAMNSHID